MFSFQSEYKRKTDPSDCCCPDLPCCFRDRWNYCRILWDTRFRGNNCHFRKLSVYGRNEYDVEKALDHMEVTT